LNIRKLKENDLEEAIDLIWKGFLEFESKDYSKEGINTFRNFLDNKDAIKKLAMYGAFKDDILVGVIGTRKNNNHIAVFFVDSKHQKQGIGKRLLEIVFVNATQRKITVNSSPFAVKIYEKLGFECSDIEQVVDGIRFTPMVYKIEK